MSKSNGKAKAAEATVLSAEDKAANKEFEKEISFLKDYENQGILAGQSLQAIHDGKLYRVQYKTFEAAIADKMGWERTYGYRLMQFAQVVADLKLLPIGNKIVEEMDLRESHVRALAESADDAPSRIKVLNSLKSEGTRITAKNIKAKADEILDSRTAPAAAKAEEPKPAQPRKPGQPSGGTTFDPTEFDSGGPTEPLDPTPTNLPKHLTEIVEQTKEGKHAVRTIQGLARALEAFCNTSAGAWMNWTEVDLLCRKLEIEIKFALFECNCPACKNSVSTKCKRCGGKGFIDKRHETQLTNDERAWLEKQK